MDSIRAIDKKIEELQKLKTRILELLPHENSRRPRRTTVHSDMGHIAAIKEGSTQPKAKRVLSKNARARIAAAQHARWAKYRKAKAKAA